MKIQLDLDNYPRLKHVFQTDKERFGEIMKHTMTHIDDALEERFNYAEQIYKRDYLDMLDEVMGAFFDPEGIVEQHYNEAEKVGLKGLQENIHPLAIFTNDAPVYNAKGENISPYKWIEQDEFDLKNWLYALFYGARFVSWKELSEYLSLDQYDLVDVLKARNFDQLSHLQESFDIQKTKGIPVGKLVPGTGRLDIGENN